jgi:metallo-beta-lactamase class B
MAAKSWFLLVSAVSIVCIFFSIANAQDSAVAKAKADAVNAHVAAATLAAREDFKNSLSMCPPLSPSPAQNLAGGAGQILAPAPATKTVEAGKAFDNLYFVGLPSVSSWAVKTSEGIILIDALNNAKEAEEVIVPALKHMGLDPAQIKYLLVTHSHGDHYGGAQYLVDKFHAHVVMSEVDWKGVEGPLQFNSPNWSAPPKRDIAISDGHKLTLGDTTITLYVTPGHTPGTISPIIPVRDNGQMHYAALWGGTAFNFQRLPSNFQRYADSADRFSEIVAKSGADVLLSNHPRSDSSLIKLDALKTRQVGQPNPFVIGVEAVQRYLKVVGECAKAHVATF